MSYTSIDFFSGDYYVIEIKRDEAVGDTLGQIFQYMGWVEKEYETVPKGIIICKHQSSMHNYATSYIEKNLGKLENLQVYLHPYTDDNPPPRKN